MTTTALVEENARLRARLAETEAALADAQDAQRRLESIVSELRREKFGRASERLDPEDRKSTRLNSSHSGETRMPSSA